MTGRLLANTMHLQSAGKKSKTLRRTRKNITGTKGRGTFLKNWSNLSPGTHERTLMMKRCGKKCFLGPYNTFPICERGTCKIKKKGVYAALVRAREYIAISKKDKYRRITAKARRLLPIFSKTK